MVDKEYIRKLYFKKGLSIRKIAKKLGHSRNTVKKMLTDGEIPVYNRTAPYPCPKMDPYRKIILEWLKADERLPKNQRHTARRIHNRLVEEYGFEGSESTTRGYVRKLRNKGKECFILLDADPGEQAQVDFGHARVIISGKEQKVCLFCTKLKYSQVPYVVAFQTERLEAFLEGHVRAFEYFGGVPEIGLYDNATTQVVKILSGPYREEQERFSSLRAHYLFDSSFCRPAKGNEKGTVEGLVGYVRRNALVPLKEFENFEELNKHLLRWCEIEMKKHETRWEEEKKRLSALPDKRFSSATLRPLKVDTYALVNIERNRYSVPSEYVGRTLLAKIYVDRIEVMEREKTVAIHDRSYKRGKTLLEIKHYLPVLEIKAHAVANARVVRELPPVFLEVRKKLQKTGLTWYREYVKILLLLRNYSILELETALKKTDVYSVENILHYLERKLPEVKGVGKEETCKYDALFGRLN